eukprot:TRINITY_DN58341_c0_g1_i1.p1 TRINITY_DN58341_c0_g1~~TRINITY_DN58341_c0_g1_i1.p1  ORF type:complete len:104 (+),score=21.11 TRINITY_DN58341_c0_g1_i1:196-507(+)
MCIRASPPPPGPSMEQICSAAARARQRGVYHCNPDVPAEECDAEYLAMVTDLWFGYPSPHEYALDLSLIHISEPTRLLSISYAVFCLKKKINKITHKAPIQLH